jgi:predicted nucleic acid-binding protein
VAAFLVDTNVLLRSVHAEAAEHGTATAAIAAILAAGDEPVIIPQVLFEFWSVATRPQDVNGLGWLPEYTAGVVFDIIRRLTNLTEPAGVFGRWFELATKYKVRGKHAHDLRIVAVMTLLGIEKLLTFNVADFNRFTEIQAIHPSELAAVD